MNDCTCPDPKPSGWPYTHHHNCPKVSIRTSPCDGCEHGEKFKDSDLSHPLCKRCKDGDKRNWRPVFVKGQQAKTLAGNTITIVEEKRDVGHYYDHVLGSDGIWRYDRPHDCGRVTGTATAKGPHPANLVYGAIGS